MPGRALYRMPSTGTGAPERRMDMLEQSVARLASDAERAADTGGKWFLRNATTNATVQPWDFVLVKPTAALTLLIPDPTTCTLARICIKNDSDNTSAITLRPPSGKKIDGASTLVMATARLTRELVSDGIEWKRVGPDTDVTEFPGPTITTAIISADQNDFTMSGFAAAFLVRMRTDTTLRKFTGFAFNSVTRPVKCLVNTTPDPFLIAHQSTSSSVANRVICPNGWDLPVMPGCAVWLGYDSSDARWHALPYADAASYPAAILEVQFGTSNPTTNDVSTTIPATPSGNQRFVLESFDVWSAGIGGSDAGTVTLTMGTTAGGTELMLAQAITSATAGGIQGGYAIASLGTSVLINNGYRFAMNAGATISLRAATTVGSVSSGKKARAFIYGSFLP